MLICRSFRASISVFIKNRILGVVAAGEYSYTELMDEVNIHTGGIDPGFVVLQPETGRPTVRSPSA